MIYSSIFLIFLIFCTSAHSLEFNSCVQYRIRSGCNATLVDKKSTTDRNCIFHFPSAGSRPRGNITWKLWLLCCPDSNRGPCLNPILLPPTVFVFGCLFSNSARGKFAYSRSLPFFLPFVSCVAGRQTPNDDKWRQFIGHAALSCRCKCTTAVHRLSGFPSPCPGLYLHSEKYLFFFRSLNFFYYFLERGTVFLCAYALNDFIFKDLCNKQSKPIKGTSEN